MLKTLIVDDDKKLRSLLNSLLVEEGDEVTTCRNGSDAISKCRKEKFDLIVTDLVMPGANGIEVLKEARKHYSDTLVILITGYASLETAIEAIREGAYDYITKPFKLEEFKIVVHNGIVAVWGSMSWVGICQASHSKPPTATAPQPRTIDL